MSNKSFVSTFSVRFDVSESRHATGAALNHWPVVGDRTKIVIQRPGDSCDYLLIVCVEPCDATAPPCRLTIMVNGDVRKDLILRHRTVACCRLPYDSISAEQEMAVAFETCALETSLPDAGGMFTLSELSLLTFSPPRASPEAVVPSLPDAPSSDADILRRFISFGDNCEFGLYQRRHGADEASFLRLAAVPFEGLVRGLQEQFAACQDPGELHLDVPHPGGEYILALQAYNMLWHTMVLEPQSKATKMIEFGHHMLCMLLRLLVANLQGGNRIVVYKRNVPLSDEDCEHLARLLLPYGVNALLVVSLAQREEQIGQVVMTENGIMMGYIDKFLAYDAANLPASDVWMRICRNAYECWRDREARRADVEPSFVLD